MRLLLQSLLALLMAVLVLGAVLLLLFARPSQQEIDPFAKGTVDLTFEAAMPRTPEPLAKIRDRSVAVPAAARLEPRKGSRLGLRLHGSGTLNKPLIVGVFAGETAIRIRSRTLPAGTALPTTLWFENVRPGEHRVSVAPEKRFLEREFQAKATTKMVDGARLATITYPPPK